jgi:hypothetical protein
VWAVLLAERGAVILGLAADEVLSANAGRGHLRLMQAIMEAAVMAVGPSKAKQRCINHTNHKGQSALTLACMNG